jgi:hypothetical protein
MNIAITHDQLRELQAHKGQLDTDSGRVFVGVKGAKDQASRLWVLRVDWRDRAEREFMETFSFRSIVGPADVAGPGFTLKVPVPGECCS